MPVALFIRSLTITLQGLFDPLNVRADGTVVFAAPVANGQIPMIALKDLGWWARYTFDHRPETSGSELNITSERIGWDYLVEVCFRLCVGIHFG
jgi:hypothetical protein